MSRLRLNGVSSGYVEIKAPDTGANNTITLPSGSGSVVVQSTSGITSFTSGPVFIGSGTSTGTASQTLQVTGGAYVSGNLGIGDANPVSPLTVYGNIAAELTAFINNANSGGYSAVRFGNSDRGTNGDHLVFGGSSLGLRSKTGTSIVFEPAGTQRAIITSSGDVGIGIVSPGAKLQVAGSSGSAQFRAGTAANGYFEINAFDSNPVYCVIGGANATSGVFGTQSNIPTILFSNNTERARVTSGGYFKASNDGTYYGSAASIHEFRQTTTADNLYVTCTNASYASVSNVHNISRAASSAYFFLFAYSGGGGDLEFNLRGDGNAFADGTWSGGGADYAEMFEWEDGNPDNEDRVGYTVSLINNKIQIAQEGDDVIGVVSGNPSVVGDASWNKWTEKYLKDEFNRYIFEEHNVVEWTDEDGKEHSYEDWNLPEGIVVPDDAVIKTHDEKGNRFTHRKLNPEYNQDLEYVAREDRQEWDAIGLVGKLRVRKGQVIGNRWIKMRDINENVEEWLVR